ncbi:aldo/keto reductase [Companilactobacillus zhachilii]|uniref:aldo/keto reductase n=1 Tax=Companilactobacillus zhachilii TaxID=2304606 RepID=UPI001920DB17|nr:aldo/keto reductase [Companilactobacillus zhachilii]MBL3530009.1 aldo/keto reductase [Companilactobacillus zhachilii]
METIKLNNGVEMPAKGYGVFQITDLKQCETSVIDALTTGYRLLDTAATYGNETAVGSAIKKSGVPRDEIFISSKVWIQDASYEKTKASFAKTLENLQTNYLDLYLIHMPYGDYHGAWRAMEELYRAGKIKAIGVCNFEANRLADLILTHEIVPAINQVEMHPFWQEKELRSVMDRYGIRTMAWAPFAEGRQGIFHNEILATIGAQYGKTPAQVVLRWLYQSHIIAIPKSVHLERIQQNFDIDDFELSQQDIIQIEHLDQRKPLILNIHDLNEVYRLHGITFEQ